MFGKKNQKNRKRPKGKNLITSGRVKAENCEISPEEAKAALRANGCPIKKIKKIRLLKYKVCISYWNQSGGVCSGFFSYRIFPNWQKQVEIVIEDCPNFKKWQVLSGIMKREFDYFPYSIQMKEALNRALQNRLYALKLTASQTVSDDVGMSIEWEYFGSLKVSS